MQNTIISIFKDLYKSSDVPYLVSLEKSLSRIKKNAVPLTELRFIKFFSNLPDGSYKYENSKKFIIHNIEKNIDNNFSLSYHLKFPQKGVQFNFWFDKISYLNSNESVTVSLHNKNERFEEDRLQTILTTSCLTELKTEVKKMFNEYK